MKDNEKVQTMEAERKRTIFFSTPNGKVPDLFYRGGLNSLKAGHDFPRYYADQQIPRNVAERYSKNLKEINDS